MPRSQTNPVAGWRRTSAKRPRRGYSCSCAASLPAQVAEATGGDGVITLGKPVSRAQIAEAVSVFASVLAKLRRYETEKRDLERRLDELRITSRAKCLLMDQMHLSEEDAHRYLEKQAMDHRMTKLEFAKSVIRLFSEG